MGHSAARGLRRRRSERPAGVVPRPPLQRTLFLQEHRYAAPSPLRRRRAHQREGDEQHPSLGGGRQTLRPFEEFRIPRLLQGPLCQKTPPALRRRGTRGHLQQVAEQYVELRRLGRRRRQGHRRGHRHVGRLRLGQRFRQSRTLDPGSAARLRLPAGKHRQGICQPRQGGGRRRPDRRLRSTQSVYRRFRRRRRSGPDLRRIRRWTHLVRERRHPHGAPLRRGTAACEQTRGDPPPSGDDRPGGVGFRRRRASRPHRRRRGRPRGLGAPHGEGQKRHAPVRIARLLHPAGRSGQIRGPLDPLRLRLGRRRKTGHHCRELGRRNRFHPQPFGRRKPRVGRSAPLHRQRQAHPHPGRGERFDTGSRRTQMGLYGALRGRLGRRRTSRHHHQLDLGQNRMVPQPRRQRRAKTRPGAARARGLGGRGPQTRLELVDARTRHARHAMAHDARGDGLERRRADGPHRPRPGGLPRLLRTFPHARRRTAAPSRTPHLPRHELLALQLQKRGSECVGRASAAERRHRRTIRTPQDLLHGLGRRRTVGPDRGQPERLLVPQRPRGAGRGVVRIHGQRRRTHTGWSHDLSDPHRLAGRRYAGTPAGAEDGHFYRMANQQKQTR